jgi:hypothetical protein
MLEGLRTALLRIEEALGGDDRGTLEQSRRASP